MRTMTQKSQGQVTIYTKCVLSKETVEGGVAAWVLCLPEGHGGGTD